MFYTLNKMWTQHQLKSFGFVYHIFGTFSNKMHKPGKKQKKAYNGFIYRFKDDDDLKKVKNNYYHEHLLLLSADLFSEIRTINMKGLRHL